MTALATMRADQCKGCGQPLSESAAAESEGKYVAPPPHRCHSCTALAIKQDEYDKAEAKPEHPRALHWRTERRH